jgi:hypothetical protein
MCRHVCTHSPAAAPPAGDSSQRAQGLFGRGQQAVLFKWAGSELRTKWQFFLEKDGTLTRIGLMDKKPSDEDMETMVYNSSAAKSPLASGARMFNKLTKGLRGGKKAAS